jgi:hypothetical protein
MNVNSLITKDYIKYDDFAVQKTNPIQTQSNPVLSAVEWANLKGKKMLLRLTMIGDYFSVLQSFNSLFFMRVFCYDLL